MTDLLDTTANQEGQGRSRRTRVKSQRALESEQTDRILARAKTQQRAGESSTAEASTSTSAAVAPPAPKRAKGKAKKQDGQTLYCICKTDGEDGRPMIECGICNDWFHFYCIHLSESEAESIHKYVCNGCEIRTGEKTTHLFDISVFPSPSPPAGFQIEHAPERRKASTATKKKPKAPSRTARQSASVSTSSDESGSEAAHTPGSSSSEDHFDDGAQPKKKARTSRAKQESRVKSSPAADRKPAAPVRKPSVVLPSGALPPARAHVLTRLTGVIRSLFGEKMDEAKSSAYVSELEAALWSHFKEVVGGKDIVGGRYKAQFNLLTSSLAKSLRPELRDSIVNLTLSPAQVAVLTPIELASEERAKEIEAAKQAVLQQTVKSREEGPADIRLGRDGLERAEDFREKEMKALQAAEDAAREREKRRESLVSQGGEEGSEVPKGENAEGQGQNPAQQSMGMMHRRSESTDIVSRPALVAQESERSESGVKAPTKNTQSPTPTPARQFSLASAWGCKDKETAGLDIGDVEMAFGEDQNQVDLSDIVVEGFEDEVDFGVKNDEESRPEDPLLARPIVWRGGLINPAYTMPAPAKTHIRHIAKRAVDPAWNVLLPHDPISMVGRVPSKDSLKHLSDARLNPKLDVVVVAMTCDPEASEDERGWWNGMIEDHIKRDRHGLYHPYGDFKRNAIPHGGARELYFIPLRPTDPAPEFTELIDGFDLPANREELIYLGVFVINRDDWPEVRNHSRSSLAVPTIVTPPQSTPSASGPPLAVPPPIPNADLQALIANLNPHAIQSLVTPPQGGNSPIAPLPQGGFTPPQGYYPGPQGYPAGPGHGYAPPGPFDPQYGAPQAYGGYAPGRGFTPAPHGGFEHRGPPSGPSAFERREGRGAQAGGRGGKGGRGGRAFEGRERDSGWGSRR